MSGISTARPSKPEDAPSDLETLFSKQISHYHGNRESKNALAKPVDITQYPILRTSSPHTTFVTFGINMDTH